MNCVFGFSFVIGELNKSIVFLLFSTGQQGMKGMKGGGKIAIDRKKRRMGYSLSIKI